MSESKLNARQFQSTSRENGRAEDPVLEAVGRLQGDEGVRHVVDREERYEDDWDPWG